MPPKDKKGAARPTRRSRRNSSQADELIGNGGGDTREASSREDATAGDDFVTGPGEGLPSPTSTVKTTETIKTATKSTKKTKGAKNEVIEVEPERDQREETEDDSNGNDDFTLPTLPKPTKPMTRDEYAEYLLAEMQLEDVVLQKAAEIKANLAKLKVPPQPEPKRTLGGKKKDKTHWESLLLEMNWLAKEFQRERRWKLNTAKRVASSAQRSNMDLESRVLIKHQEEEKAKKKLAQWIAKEVMAGFWNKAHKVVAFKVKNEVDRRKKEVLDRQMDVLLRQTQKYSGMLAERLRGGDGKILNTANSQPVSQAPSGMSNLAGLKKEEVFEDHDHSDDDSRMDYRSGEDDDMDDEATLEEEERLARMEAGDVKRLVQERMDETKGLEEDAEMPLEDLLPKGYKPVSVADVPVKREGSVAAATPPTWTDDALDGLEGLDDDPMDYQSGEDDDMDDEETLEEEERLALMESGKALGKLQAEECAGLEHDAEVPLEDLLPRGYKPVGYETGDEGDADVDMGDAEDAEDDEEEYRSGQDDDEDDEETLEEEERLALLESGKTLGKLQAEECAGLEHDAEVPLEDLLPPGYKPVSQVGDGRGATVARDATVSNIKQEDDALDTDPSRPSTSNQTKGMSGAIEAMAAAQPTGYTLATTQVRTPVPFLLKGQLREYQHIGLDWLVTLYHKHLNGILADEMGLGKTIQTIALLSWLACERGDWGPHLIVVPTSVMLNWEMEFKRWCPAFKLLTYYGTPKERAEKRKGWSKPNAFHVCITSYTLILQDARVFRRKKWKYLILDEAHMIKNWKSQRWQTLLNFNSKRRLLITGTPLQNDLMELWSLMHFLMPQVFASHAQFKDWFSNPLTGMVEGSAEYNKAIITRLHSVLRPFLLRRLKKDVEKQLPEKHEHVIKCRLSKRQRQLYEEYVAQTETKNVLASGNFMGIMNCLMQLRKVCNHPDLFEGRPIVSAFDMEPLSIQAPTLVAKDQIELSSGRKNLDLLLLEQASQMSSWEKDAAELAEPRETFLEPQTTPEEELSVFLGSASNMTILRSLGRTPAPKSLSVVSKFLQDLAQKRKQWRTERAQSLGSMSWARCTYAGKPVGYGAGLSSLVRVVDSASTVHTHKETKGYENLEPNSRNVDIDNDGASATTASGSALRDMVKLPDRRAEEMSETLKQFVFVIPKARSKTSELVSSVPDTPSLSDIVVKDRTLWKHYTESTALLHTQRIRKQLFFPDKRLLQYDCGKLQELAALLTKLKSGGHRALIFTQMSKMLDILEAFLNIYGHTYVRLDGATKPEMRQTLMQRFNTNPKIFCFILSTRSGGVGMNLTGADTVIFYDSDWNPAMDAQAQDRCHRIGQTREVHIYRLISEHTIEENILRKSDQKRHLDFLAIQSGGFNTDILYGVEDVAGAQASGDGSAGGLPPQDSAWKEAMRAAEDEDDAQAAVMADKETAAELEEFAREAPAPSAVSEEDKHVKEEEEDGEGGSGSKDTKETREVREANAAKDEADADDEAMREVERLAYGQGGEYDPMQALNNALRPIERYAVRFIESYSERIDKEALTAQMEATYNVQQFDIDAMEEEEAEREADIDADEEANVVADWDQAAATRAYEEQMLAAEAEEDKRVQAEIAWWEKHGAEIIAQEEARSQKRYRGGRPKKADMIQAASLAAEAAAKAQAEKEEKEKGSKTLVYPWDIEEDLVLVAVVYILCKQADPSENDAFIWNTASGALAAGCAARDAAHSQISFRKGKLRTAAACRKRYKQLQLAYLAAKTLSDGDAMGSEQFVQQLIAPAIQVLDASLKEAEKGKGPARTAVSTIAKALEARRDSKMANDLAIEMHSIRMGTSRWSALLGHPLDDSLKLSLPLAAGIVKVVKSRCGDPQAVQKIEGKLGAVIQAAKIESAGFMQY